LALAKHRHHRRPVGAALSLCADNPLRPEDAEGALDLQGSNSQGMQSLPPPKSPKQSLNFRQVLASPPAHRIVLFANSRRSHLLLRVLHAFPVHATELSATLVASEHTLQKISGMNHILAFIIHASSVFHYW
jgi:hypothetical protein